MPAVTHLDPAQAFGRIRNGAAAKRGVPAHASLPTAWWVLPAVLFGTLGWAYVIKGLIGWIQ